MEGKVGMAMNAWDLQQDLPWSTAGNETASSAVYGFATNAFLRFPEVSVPKTTVLIVLMDSFSPIRDSKHLRPGPIFVVALSSSSKSPGGLPGARS